MANEKTIYVYLLNEGIDVWRPVKVIQVKENIYKILSANPDPKDEIWQFNKGDFVRCESKSLSQKGNYQDKLVVVEKIEMKTLNKSFEYRRGNADAFPRFRLHVG